MNAFIKRNRIVLLSIVLCLFSLHMALSQRKRGGGEMLISKAISTIAMPFEFASLGAYNAVSTVWSNYIFLVGLKDENLALRDSIALLTEENNSLREAEGENERLKRLLALEDETSLTGMPARILAFNLATWTKTIKIDKGTKHGVAEDMPVISPVGVVGRVIEARRYTSIVLLITDPRSNIDVITQRTRVRGLARGNGSKGLGLMYIRELDDVKAGDQVITAGDSGIFPKGLYLGEVTVVARGEDNFFKRIELSPKAGIQRLEEVLVTGMSANWEAAE